MASKKASLVAAVKVLHPAMSAVADTFSVAQLEAIMTAAGKGAKGAAPDGDVIPPVDVEYGDGRFVQVACSRYQGRVRVGIRRGWTKDGERQTVLSAMKVPYLESRDQVQAVVDALTATLEHIS
jgi:hypothetical protein